MTQDSNPAKKAPSVVTHLHHNETKTWVSIPSHIYSKNSNTICEIHVKQTGCCIALIEIFVAVVYFN